MNFDELDVKMREFEQSMDQRVLPEVYMVARLDGRGFSRLTKELCDFEKPFDVRFRDMMVKTTEELMNCGFRVVYGYTESDEISLLFHREESTFGRKVRKYNSILAGQGRAALALQLGRVVALDCRMIPLPNEELVQDYFLWRQEDACRNALNSHCYWLLRSEGVGASEATARLEGKSIAYKNELLFSRGINFDKLPLWQKRGVGLYWAEKEVQGFDPKRGVPVTAIRRGLKTEYELPIGKAYADMISGIL